MVIAAALKTGAHFTVSKQTKRNSKWTMACSIVERLITSPVLLSSHFTAAAASYRRLWVGAGSLRGGLRGAALPPLHTPLLPLHPASGQPCQAAGLSLFLQRVAFAFLGGQPCLLRETRPLGGFPLPGDPFLQSLCLLEETGSTDLGEGRAMLPPADFAGNLELQDRGSVVDEDI